MHTLITGAAGFIGAGVAKELLESGGKVLGIDNFNDYYDVNLKRTRVANLLKHDNFKFYEEDIRNCVALIDLIKKYKVKKIVHLAAQAGVRYSLINPQAYIENNIDGFFNVIEAAKATGIEKFVYASSSSVYGMIDGTKAIKESSEADRPESLYAATKRSNELLAHSYAKLYGLPCVALRYFTVYGPWGRPDMAIFGFTKRILSNIPIEIFNNGEMLRDFTYIDDVAKATIAVLNKDTPTSMKSSVPSSVYNVGNNSPTKLLELITILEEEIGKAAIKEFLPMQAGDVINTWADNTALRLDFQVNIATDIRIGIRNFVSWYKAFYNV